MDEDSMIYEQTPVRLKDGELESFITQYLANVGATQAPSVMLEGSNGKRIHIRPNTRNTLIVSEYDYDDENKYGKTKL